MDGSVFDLAALTAIGGGAVSLYLGAAHQRIRPRPWPPGPSRTGAALGLAAGWLCWCAVLHPLTALFATMTLAMALLTLIPLVAALATTRTP